jgi:protein-disulfide isomerase
MAHGPVVARIEGKPIFEEDLWAVAPAQLRQLKKQEYDVKLNALDSLIEQRALQAESKARGITTEKLFELEVKAVITEPTEAEVEAYYIGQSGKLNHPLDEVKEQIKQSLKQSKLLLAKQDYLKRLREKANVSILLEPPRTELGYDPLRLKGSPKAPVIIVEFSDFQCPFCQQIQPRLKKLLAKYEGHVSLAFRDFPLPPTAHPQAQLAAEASRCAAEQNRFWEYHDLLFSNPRNLDHSGLVEFASNLRLDTQRFDACLTSRKYSSKVEEDLKEGLKIGVSGTPSFLVNGVLLGSSSSETFEKAIESELARASDKPLGTSSRPTN